MKIKGLFILFLFSVMSIYAIIDSPKISPELRYLTALNKEQLTILLSKNDYFAIKKVGNEFYFGGLIEIDGNTFNRNKYGIKVTSQISKNSKLYLTGWIPFLHIKDIVNNQNIIRLEVGIKNELAVQKNLQIPVGDPVVGCNALGIPLEKPGEGVLVGLVDSGIDYTHKDFCLDNLNYDKTRIVSIWDQTLNNTEFIINQNNLYDYGKIFYRNDIEKSINNNTDIGSKDVLGHGTVVAGIIAGNGEGGGAGFSSDDLKGIAPYAKIAVVKSEMWTNSVIDAIYHLNVIAEQYKMPLAINLSLGNHSGAHDGSSLFERILTGYVGEGKTIIASAGNDGDKKIHTYKKFNHLSSHLFLVSANQQLNDVTKFSNTICISFWINENDFYAIKIISPEGEATESIQADAYGIKEFSNGSTAFIDNSFSNPNHPLGDKEIFILIYNNNSIDNKWWLSFQNYQKNGNGDVHGWIAYPYGGSVVFENDYDPQYTLTIPATSPDVISVGAYISNNFWYAQNGNGYEYLNYQHLGNIASFSSLGPTRNSLNLLFGKDHYEKPEIIAPGVGIISTLSVFSKNNIKSESIFQDRTHCISQGTSIAAPHVTGAAALILQKHPTYSQIEIKNLLIKNLYKDKNTSDAYNYIWGYGKLNISDTLYDLTGVDNWIKF